MKFSQFIIIYQLSSTYGNISHGRQVLSFDKKKSE